MSSSGGRPLSDRLKQFADRFAALGRPARPAGYSGLGGGAADDLSAPLVGPDSSAGDYAAAGGGGGGRYAPPRAQGGAMGATAVAADAGAGAAVHLPTPVSEKRRGGGDAACAEGWGDEGRGPAPPFR